MTKNWHVYIIKCADQSLYTGITSDLHRRIKEHNLGKASKYTRSRLPVQRVYFETLPDRSEALRREIQIKKLTRSNKIALIRSHNARQKKKSTKS